MIKNKKNNLEVPENLPKNEAHKPNILNNLSNNNKRNNSDIKKEQKKNLINNNSQENSNVRNKQAIALVNKPVMEKVNELSEDENFTNKFLSDVISKLISHPLHIESDEGETHRHKRKLHATVDKPNIMVISNSNGTRIENKNVKNFNSHNNWIYNKL